MPRSSRSAKSNLAFSEDELRDAEEFQPQNLPIWREAFLGVDWLSLRVSAVHRGDGIPRGDGSAVVLVPGFLGSDRYLGEMRSWLSRIGYTPYLSGIGRNIQCPSLLVARLHQTMLRAADESGGKVHLIGHSLGGVIARSAAIQWPELTASVITMGSPFRGVRAHPFVLLAASIVRGGIAATRRELPNANQDCYTGKCECDFVRALKTALPDSIAETAIYTKTDGVVDWRRCQSGLPETDIEVNGTHVGRAFNRAVYSHIAKRLAAASATAPVAG
jgi:pimeloyl-ACP methyl ester carboxylesterase